MDLSFVYEETSQLYSRKVGCPPTGPVVIVKYLLVGSLYGIPSERQMLQHITPFARSVKTSLSTHFLVGTMFSSARPVEQD